MRTKSGMPVIGPVRQKKIDQMTETFEEMVAKLPFSERQQAIKDRDKARRKPRTKTGTVPLAEVMKYKSPENQRAIRKEAAKMIREEKARRKKKARTK